MLPIKLHACLSDNTAHYSYLRQSAVDPRGFVDWKDFLVRRKQRNEPRCYHKKTRKKLWGHGWRSRGLWSWSALSTEVVGKSLLRLLLLMKRPCLGVVFDRLQVSPRSFQCKLTSLKHCFLNVLLLAFFRLPSLIGIKCIENSWHILPAMSVESKVYQLKG